MYDRTMVKRGLLRIAFRGNLGKTQAIGIPMLNCDISEDTKKKSETIVLAAI